VDSSRINDYPVIKMERLTVKGQVGKDKGLGDDSTWTESDLLTEMREKAQERFNVDKVDQILEEITVDFEILGDTEEYMAIKGLEKALLYDTVSVINEEIGLNVKLFVSELEWDFIRQKIKALKLTNINRYAGKATTTGYQVQAKSIGSGKLSDDVTEEIMDEVWGIIQANQ
jgi:phage-related protein